MLTTSEINDRNLTKAILISRVKYLRTKKVRKAFKNNCWPFSFVSGMAAMDRIENGNKNASKIHGRFSILQQFNNFNCIACTIANLLASFFSVYYCNVVEWQCKKFSMNFSLFNAQ